MADDYFRRRYTQADFLVLATSIGEALPLLRTALAELTLTVPVNEVRLDLSQNAAVVEWLTLPLQVDIDAVDAVVAAFTGGTTTSAPIEINSFGAVTSTSATPTVKITHTTQPLDEGTYQVIWNSSVRMLAVIANTGVEGRIAITRSDGAAVSQSDAWDLANLHVFNGAITFVVLAGQTITATLSFLRLGASGTAEMSGARITIDKIS
jgi:hypothetical protein